MVTLRDNLLEYSSAGSGLAVRTKRSHIHDNVFRHNGAYGFSRGVIVYRLVTADATGDRTPRDGG